LYDSLKSACKTYVSINGGSHCQMAEDNFLCNFGEATCNPKPAISRAVQHQALFRFLVPWLRFHLLNDCKSGQTFDSLAAKDVAVSIRKNCVLCPVNQTDKLSSFNVSAYPMPVDDILNITITNTAIARCDLFSVKGKMLYQWNFEVPAVHNISLNLPGNLKSGIYLLRINSCAEQQIIRIVKR
jgi:Secretion system C-terminal sorting domain